MRKKGEKRNEILIMLRDIARRDGEKLRNLIESDDIQNILNDRGKDTSHVGAALHRYIRELRYPSVQAYNERFHKKLKEVKLDRKFHLQLPENFEKWEFRLVIPFSSHEEFQESIDTLQETGECPAFKELMKMRY